MQLAKTLRKIYLSWINPLQSCGLFIVFSIFLGILPTQYAAAATDAEWAQVPTNWDWDSVTQVQPPVQDPLFPSQFFEVNVPQDKIISWANVIGNLKDIFQSETPDSPEKQKFINQIALLQSELSTIERSPDRENLAKNAIGLNARIFRSNENTSRWYIFDFGGANQIELNKDMDGILLRNLCWGSVIVNRVLALYILPAEQTALQTLNTDVQKWQNYQNNSYSQFPWELLVNGFFAKSTSLLPPSSQLILLHPSLGIELSGDTSNFNCANTYFIQLLGGLWYTDDRDNSLGFSGVVSVLPSNQPVGIGPAIQWGKWQLGYIFRDRNNNGLRGDSVLVSVDLYGAVFGTDPSVKDAVNRAISSLSSNN